MTRETAKNRAFVPLLLIGFLILVANDYYDWMDECVLAYACVQILATFSAIVFTVWALRVYQKTGRRPSDVYLWVTILFYATSFNYHFMLRARLLWLSNNHVDYQRMMDSTLWHYRVFPVEVAMMYLLAVIIGRMLGSEREVREHE